MITVTVRLDAPSLAEALLTCVAQRLRAPHEHRLCVERGSITDSIAPFEHGQHRAGRRSYSSVETSRQRVSFQAACDCAVAQLRAMKASWVGMALTQLAMTLRTPSTCSRTDCSLWTSTSG